MMRVLILSLFIAFQANAQINGIKNRVLPKWVKNQKRLALSQIPKYLARLPKTISECAMHYVGGSDYHFLLNQSGLDILNNIFRFSAHKRTPTTDNQFAFGYNEIGQVCEHQFGYCRGYTASKVLWNRMSFFDPENKLGQTIPQKTDSERWHQFYFKLIDNIMNNRDVVVIPGFKNLYEFSDSTPKIKRYLMEHVAKMWARENVNFTGFYKIFRSIFNKFDTKEAIKLHQDLSHKINTLGYNPIVFITNESMVKSSVTMPNNASIHVMQAYKVSEIDKDGIFKIHFWDVGSPHEARRAPSIYKISTQSKDKKGKVLVESDSGSNFDKRKQGDENYSYRFADIEQVPFDDLAVGQDSVKLIKFFDQNPEFFKYLETLYQERLSNPPRPYYPKYSGNMETIPPLVLKDGSQWQWQKEQLNNYGEIHIDEYVINELPNEVKEVFKHFDRDWKKRNNISPHIQKPSQLSYSLEKDPSKTYNYEWPIEWLQYNGQIKLPRNYKELIPKDLVTFLKESYLNFKPSQLNNPKFLEVYYRKIPIEKDKNIIIKMDFIDKQGNLFIPADLEQFVDPELKSFLVENNLWNIKKQIKLDRLKDRSVIRMDGKEWYIPPRYYKDDNILIIPDGEIEKWPEWVRNIFCGYNPSKPCPEKIHINDIHSLTLHYRKSFLESETVNFPFTWGPRYQNVGLSTRPNYHVMGMNIPVDELSFIPEKIKTLIVGNGGTFPPQNLKLHNQTRSIVLKDGSYYHFPMSWVKVEFGPRGMIYTLNIPRSDINIIPQQVVEEIFSTGPIKLKAGKDIDITKIQENITWYKAEGSSSYKPLIFPRKWMNKDGNITLPTQEVIDRFFTPEEQKRLSNRYDNFGPGQTLK